MVEAISHEGAWTPTAIALCRPSYKAIAGLTVAGAALTAYLTVQKVTGAPVVCLASGGCGSVLNSDYATVFGIPLSLLGLLGYGGTAALALAGAAAGSREAPLPRFGVLAGSTVLATCSACLLFLLATKFQGEACTWCLTSAALSIGSAAAAAQGFDGSELRQAAPKGAALVAATVIGLSTAWSGARPPNSLASFELAYQVRPAVETSSSQQGISLAQQLKQSGAKMYGAFWCSHCLEQKEEFGQQAMKDFPYVECYPDGFGKGKDINPQCRDAKVEAFPSWVIGGTKYEGKQTFTQLKQHLAGQ
eukprot:jgi/Astpho2/774/Aster-00633